MFGLSFTEVLIIAALALIVLGPKRLPEMARTVGKGLRELRRAGDELKGSLDAEVYADDPPPPPAPTRKGLPPSEPWRPPPGAADGYPDVRDPSDGYADVPAEAPDGSAAVTGGAPGEPAGPREDPSGGAADAVESDRYGGARRTPAAPPDALDEGWPRETAPAAKAPPAPAAKAPPAPDADPSSPGKKAPGGA